MKKFLALLMMVAVLTTCFAYVASANDQNVVNVSTAEELLAAIASDTTIVLAPGRYVLKSEKIVEEYDNGYVWEWDMPKPVYIEGLSNVTIEGNGAAEIALDVGIAPVVQIMNSSNITLSGLILGHDVPEFGCEGEGYVVALYNADNIDIINCDLYGCGVEAINAWGAGNVRVNNTVLRDCMIDAASFRSMKGDITFTDCQFLRNAYSDYYAQTESCLNFTRNEEEGESGNVYIKNCVFEDNLNCQFTESFSAKDENYIFVEGCTFTNNAWETAINVKSFNYGYWTTHYFEDQKPVIVDGRTLVPLRGVLENLGYAVDWNAETRSAVITRYNNNIEVVVPIDGEAIYKNGVAIPVEVPACLINNRTMVPLRAIAEAFDITVDWDNETRSVLLYENE